jgi:AcrR family transcriptional regulator
VGHREQLLAGAKHCLYERGFTRTTARDIVAVSNTNLASIGYHFGSKDALLTAAMVEALSEWGDALEEAVRPANSTDLYTRLEEICSGVIASVREQPSLWTASAEVGAEAFRQKELAERLKNAYRESRPWFTEMILRDREVTDERTARAVGSLILAIISGLSVQWLLDPDDAPSGPEIAAALRAILEASNPVQERSVEPS